MALAPEIASFGDGSHQQGETGLTISGGGFGAFAGRVLMAQNADGSGLVDLLTVSGPWNDIEIAGIDIPASPNNSAGTVYAIVEREDLAWSQGFQFTLTLLGINGSLSQSIGEISISAVGTALAQGSLSQSIGDISVNAAGMLPIVGALSQSIGTISLSAVGTLGEPITGSLNAPLGDITGSSAGSILVAGALSASIGQIQLSCAGGVLVTGSLSANIGEITLDTDAGYPAGIPNSRSIRLPAGGVWLIDPDLPAWCEVDWSTVISDGVTLSSVAYTLPSAITADDTAIDQDLGKWAIHVDGTTHAGMHQIPLTATLSNAQTLNLIAPLRVFNE